MKGLWIALGVVGVIVLVVLLIFGSYVGAKNQMVQLNADVDQSWSQVQIVQQRRADLIPNLVETVKGYTKEESTVLTNIANARAGVISAPDRPSSIAANGKLDLALVQFQRLQENYPQLQSNQQFMRLQDELAGTENRIAVERGRYNNALKAYNVYIQQFPNSIWANMAGFHVRDEYFKGQAGSENAPKVDFSH
ncbi:MAG TPA: LemA family protein [Acidobacteriaceae bacterium]